MANTPEPSHLGSDTLRRLAWCRGKPMPKTLEALIEATGRTMAQIRRSEAYANRKDEATCNERPFQTHAKMDLPRYPASKSKHNDQQLLEQEVQVEARRGIFTGINLDMNIGILL